MSEWVRVEDGFPDEGVQVLIIDTTLYGGNEMRLDYRVHIDHDDHIWACKPDQHSTVTHWMERPQPPKEKK